MRLPTRPTAAATLGALLAHSPAAAGTEPDPALFQPALFAGPAPFINPSTTAIFVGTDAQASRTVNSLARDSFYLAPSGSQLTPHGRQAAIDSAGYALLDANALPEASPRVHLPLCWSQGSPGDPDDPLRILVSGQWDWYVIGDLPGGTVDAEAFAAVIEYATLQLDSGDFASFFGLRAVGASDAGITSPADPAQFRAIASLRTPPASTNDLDLLDRIDSPSAFVWTSCNGMVNIGSLPGGGTRAIATATRPFNFSLQPGADLAAGYAESALGVQPFVWTNDLGMLPLLDPDGNPAQGAVFESQNALNPGQSVFGTIQTKLGFEACLWSLGDAPQGLNAYPLGDLPGGEHQSVALGLMDSEYPYLEYHTVFGWGSTELGQEAFILPHNGKMIALGDLPGGTVSSVALSAYENVVVGRATTDLGNEAFIWTQADGMLRLADVLQATGLTLDGWHLLEATSVNGAIADLNLDFPFLTPEVRSLTIRGLGINPQGIEQAWAVNLAAKPGATTQGLPYRPGNNITLTADFLGAQATPNEPLDRNANSIIDLQDLNALLSELH